VKPLISKLALHDLRQIHKQHIPADFLGENG
jgi:hypothetical protein